MPASLVEGNSLLAVEIGTVMTRAAYFDVVEGQYRFISMAQAPTTIHAPLRNVAYGIQQAIEELQTLIGKPLMDEDGRLTIPSQPDGVGVDNFAATISAGSALKTVVVGLLPDVSLKSVENLAQTTYTRIVDTISMNDQRRPEEQVDAILKYNPDLILVAGGTNGGATHTIQKILELLGLASYILPENKRPSLLFAGNEAMQKTVYGSLKNLMANVVLAPNLRPLPEAENLGPAQHELSHLVAKIREKQMPDLEEIRMLAGGMLTPAVQARGRMVHYLGRYFNTGHGILSADIGASSTSIATNFENDLYLNVFTQFGLGESLSSLLRHTTLDEILRWIPNNLPNDRVRDYIYQKALYPSAVPVTVEELAIEQALVRHHLLAASRLSLSRLPARYRGRNNLMPSMEPIIASGAALTNTPNLGQKLLMLLDGLQPTGTTTLAMDQNNLLAMLGAAAQQNTILPVQVIDSGGITDLAKVISPVCNVNYGTPILRVKLTRDDGSVSESEVKMGNLQVLPLESGHTAQLELRPLQKADVGLGPGKAGVIDILGSSLGVVIDARGRPLRLPSDHDKRRELLTLWKNKLGA